MYDLSICIPARNEQWLSATIDNILENKRGKTEILVGLDGQWADPPIVDHPDVRILYVPESIGQRGMQNRLVRMSRAKYVAKTDAHVAFSEGFDVELINTFKELGDDITVAPLMKNLHAFDWKCMKCGKRTYQGPLPTSCEDCDNTTNFTQRQVFKPRDRTPNSTSYRFDNMLHFQYFGEWKEKQIGDYVESMSLQGSFFMCTRENYWKKELCDETWGSWGQQGSEVAIKTWLSGGRVIINKKCWYAHLFRTQSGFSFPYSQSGSGQQRARDICNDIFKNNKWPKQTRNLDWLVEKFWPVPGWEQADLDALKNNKVNKGIIYFTDNQLNLKIAKKVQEQIRSINLPIVSASLKPMDNMGKNIVVDGERGYLTMYRQILAALENSDAEIIFFCEHDVLYHHTHFAFTPPKKDVFYYNQNWWKVRSDGHAISWDADQVSGLCCYRELAIDFYKKRIETFDPDNFDRRFEPMSGRGSEVWNSEYPNIDIRHTSNLTRSKWSIDDFRRKDTAKNLQESKLEDIQGWDLELKDIF